MKPYKPAEWAKKLGISKNIVTNVHGAIRQKPSLEYIVAVSKAVGKSVEYLLWGDITKNDKIADPPEITDLLEGARRVLTSGNPVAFSALERNIRYFDQAVEAERQLKAIKEDSKQQFAELKELLLHEMTERKKLEQLVDQMGKTKKIKKQATG